MSLAIVGIITKTIKKGIVPKFLKDRRDQQGQRYDEDRDEDGRFVQFLQEHKEQAKTKNSKNGSDDEQIVKHGLIGC